MWFPGSLQLNTNSYFNHVHPLSSQCSSACSLTPCSSRAQTTRHMWDSVTYDPLALIIFLGPYQYCHGWDREDEARSLLEIGFDSNPRGGFNTQWKLWPELRGNCRVKSHGRTTLVELKVLSSFWGGFLDCCWVRWLSLGRTGYLPRRSHWKIRVRIIFKVSWKGGRCLSDPVPEEVNPSYVWDLLSGQL